MMIRIALMLIIMISFSSGKSRLSRSRQLSSVEFACVPLKDCPSGGFVVEKLPAMMHKLCWRQKRSGFRTIEKKIDAYHVSLFVVIFSRLPAFITKPVKGQLFTADRSLTFRLRI